MVFDENFPNNQISEYIYIIYEYYYSVIEPPPNV